MPPIPLLVGFFILATVGIYAIRRNKQHKAAQAAVRNDRIKIIGQLNNAYSMGLSGDAVRAEYDIRHNRLRLFLGGPICLVFGIYPVARRRGMDPRWTIFMDLPNGERHEVTDAELAKLRARALDLQDEFVRNVRLSHIPEELLRPAAPVAP